ncbi:hypothetical protein PHMEG_00014693 [Phytophthora megakarya]|uniref:Peptidase A2 domain-containing protein n=1 Tax=Phytophthora megakarya TaxID=4795 RepID=A0A225W470_9STRA|nr:hypothetical protein PHMEG_00014693 [Phytophthora megakarya]
MGNAPSQFQVFANHHEYQESHEVIGDSKIQIYSLNPQIMSLPRRSRSLARSQITDGQRPWIYYRENLVVTGSTIRHEYAKITGKIPNEKAILLLDTGAEVSIVDTAFARKIGCYIDSSQIQDCVGIGDNVYQTEGKTRIKVILAGSLVYFFDIRVGDLTGQQAILGMDFMVLILHQDQRIGIWLDGDHVPRIPGFISIGSRRYMEWQNLVLEATTDTRSEEMEVKIPLAPAVERSEYKTPRVILQRSKAMSIQCRKVEASEDQDMPLYLPSDNSPSDKSPSEIRPLDLASVASEESDLSSIANEHSISYAVTVKEVLEDFDQMTPDVWATDPSSEETKSVVEAREEGGRDGIGVANQDQLHSRGQEQGTSPSKCGASDPSSVMSVQSGKGHVTSDPSNDKCVASMSQQTDMDPLPVAEDQPGASDLDLTWDSDQDYAGYLYAEDVDGQMAVLPEVPVTTVDVKIEDIQLCGSDNQTSEDIDRLCQRIGKF